MSKLFFYLSILFNIIGISLFTFIYFGTKTNQELLFYIGSSFYVLGVLLSIFIISKKREGFLTFLSFVMLITGLVFISLLAAQLGLFGLHA